MRCLTSSARATPRPPTRLLQLRRPRCARRIITRALDSPPKQETAPLIKPGTTLRPPGTGRGAPRWRAVLQSYGPGALAQRIKSMKLLGLDFSPELVAISMVYLVQGILGLSRLALSFFYKDTLNLGPAEVAFLTGIAGIPWVIKPLYGFISDSIPLWGYHRRSYLVLAGLTGVGSWTCLCFFVHDPTTAAAAMLGAALSTAASDVLVDSLVVERARDAPQAVAGSLQSLCWGSAAVGGIASAYWSGWLVESFGTRFVFGLTAMFPLVVSLSAFLIDEQRIVKCSGTASGPSTPSLSEASHRPIPLSSQASGVYHRQAGTSSAGQGAGVVDTSLDLERVPVVLGVDGGAGGEGVAVLAKGTAWQQMTVRARMLWSAVTRKDILLPTLFVFVWQATPSAESALFYFQTNELGFTPEFLGRVRLVGSLASLAGVALYNTSLKKVPLRTILWWAMILGTTLGATQLILVSRLNTSLGLSDQLFVLGDAALLTALGQASFMPILVLAARLCPQGVEATLFATLMSVLNAGSFLGSGLGAGMTKLLGVTSTDFTNLFTLVLICNVAQLLPAPLLRLIPETLDRPEDDDDDTPSGASPTGKAMTPMSPGGKLFEADSPQGLNGGVAQGDVEVGSVGGGVHGPPGGPHGHGDVLAMGIGSVVHASEGHPKAL